MTKMDLETTEEQQQKKWTVAEKIDDQLSRFLLEERLTEAGEITSDHVSTFERRLRAALSEEEVAENLQYIQEFVESLPLEVQYHQVETANLRNEYASLENKKQPFAFYQIPKNEVLRAKIATLGLSEEEGKRVLKANQKQREKLLGQYFDQKVDALLRAYQTSRNTEQGALIVVDKIDALVTMLGDKYEEKAASALNKIFEIAEDREVIVYKAKEANKGKATPKVRTAPRLKQDVDAVRESLERYVPALLVPEVLQQGSPVPKYDVREPLYFKEPKNGFRTEDPVPTIGLLEYLTAKPAERQHLLEEGAVIAGKALVRNETPAQKYSLPRQRTRSDAVQEVLSEPTSIPFQEQTGFVLVGDPYIAISKPIQNPKKKKVNPAQKIVDKMRAKSAAKKKAVEEAQVYATLSEQPLYTPKLVELALAMPSEFYRPLPAIVIPEPTVLREAKAPEERSAEALAYVRKILDDHAAAVTERKEIKLREEIRSFGSVAANFFNNYNPEIADFTTVHVPECVVEPVEVLEKRVHRETRFSRIRGAVAAATGIAATLAALVGGLAYFAKIADEATNALYESLKPKIVETTEKPSEVVSKTPVSQTPYTNEKIENKGAKDTAPVLYQPNATPSTAYDSLPAYKKSSFTYHDARVEMPLIDVDYTPVISDVPIKINRPTEVHNELSNELSTSTIKEIIALYEAQRTPKEEYRISPWKIAETKAGLEAIEQKLKNRQEMRALLNEYDAILADPYAYEMQ